MRAVILAGLDEFGIAKGGAFTRFPGEEFEITGGEAEQGKAPQGVGGSLAVKVLPAAVGGVRDQSHEGARNGLLIMEHRAVHTAAVERQLNRESSPRLFAADVKARGERVGAAPLH